MSEIAYTIEHGRLEDMEQVYEMAYAEGWRVTLDLLKEQFLNHPEGCFVARSPDGEVISHCHATNLDDSTGTLELFLTRIKYRGKGIGKKLFEKCMAHLGDRNVSINSMKDKVDMYKNKGFAVQSHFLYVAKFVLKKIYSRPSPKELDIVLLNDSILPKVIEYDNQIQASERAQYMKRHFNKLSIVTYVAMDGRNVLGFGCITPGHDVYRVMPLYADNSSVASLLIQSLLSDIPEGKYIEVGYLDGNKNNVNTVFERFGKRGEDIILCSRLYSKYEVSVPYSKVYSLLNYQNCIV